MKGIILAGGRATRLRPLTLVTSKQLLPVYNQPMIYYPLQTLLKAGIRDILIIVSPEYSGHFLNLLGSGEEFGAHFSFAVQKEPRGLADAFIVGANFVGQDNVTLILGDNIFDEDFSQDILDFKSGGLVFIKKLDDIEKVKTLGVIEADKSGKVISIEEKPEKPKTNYVGVGLYVYDNRVVQVAKSLQPSSRGEIELVSYRGSQSTHQFYFDRGELRARAFDSFWADAGSFDSLLNAGNYWAQKANQV